MSTSTPTSAPIHIDQGMPVGDGTRVWIALRPEKIHLAKTGGRRARDASG